jgi:hypothetical protein
VIDSIRFELSADEVELAGNANKLSKKARIWKVISGAVEPWSRGAGGAVEKADDPTNLHVELKPPPSS